MRSAHAVPVFALVAAASVVALLLRESGINGTSPDFQHVLMTRWRFFLLFAVIFGVGGWWTARTWRKLWRAGRSQWERLVYDYGVRGFGFSTAVGLIAIITWLG
jgi:H+/Cl- antiporter ClcA